MWEVRQGLQERLTFGDVCILYAQSKRCLTRSLPMTKAKRGEFYICLQTDTKPSKQPSAAWGMWVAQAWLLKGDSEGTEQIKAVSWVRWWFKGASELWTQEKRHLLNYGHWCLTLSLSYRTAFVLVQLWMWHISFGSCDSKCAEWCSCSPSRVREHLPLTFSSASFTGCSSRFRI